MLNRAFDWSLNALNLTYPFESDLSPETTRAVFADAYIVDSANIDTDTPVDERLELYDLYMPNATSCTLLQLQYVTSETPFFTGTVEYNVYSFGEWTCVTASSTEERKWVTLLLHLDDVLFPYELNKDLDSLEMTFVPRTHQQEVQRVHSIEVTDDITTMTHVLTGDIELVPGYNIDMSVGVARATSDALSNTAQRTLAQVNIDAVAAAGAGLVPSPCDESDVIRSIGGVGPDEAGNFILSLEGCFRETMPFAGGGGTVTVPSTETINLDNDCEACCACEDYADAYNEALDIQRRAIPIGYSLDKTRTDLKFVIEKMREEKEEREQKDIEILAVSRSGWIVNILIVLYNNPPGDEALGEVLLGTNYPQPAEIKIVEYSAHVYEPSEDEVWRPYDIGPDAFPPNPFDVADPLVAGGGETIRGNSYLAIALELYFEKGDGTNRVDGNVVNFSVDGDSYGTDDQDVTLLEPFGPEGY